MDSSQNKTHALIAVFDLITNAAKTLDSSGVNVATKASAARDLALAYRYAAGGQQPGAVTIEKG